MSSSGRSKRISPDVPHRLVSLVLASVRGNNHEHDASTLRKEGRKVEAETLDRISDLAERLATKKRFHKYSTAAEICDAINAGLGLNIHFNSTAGRYAEACFRRRIEELEYQELVVQAHEFTAPVAERIADYGHAA
jgi:hypothetical protein